jgi:hypothetical protein
VLASFFRCASANTAESAITFFKFKNDTQCARVLSIATMRFSDADVLVEIVALVAVLVVESSMHEPLSRAYAIAGVVYALRATLDDRHDVCLLPGVVVAMLHTGLLDAQLAFTGGGGASSSLHVVRASKTADSVAAEKIVAQLCVVVAAVACGAPYAARFAITVVIAVLVDFVHLVAKDSRRRTALPLVAIVHGTASLCGVPIVTAAAATLLVAPLARWLYTKLCMPRPAPPPPMPQCT